MTARTRGLLPAVFLMAWAITITLTEAAHIQTGAITLLLLNAASTVFWATVFHWPVLVPVLSAAFVLGWLAVMRWAPGWWAAALDASYLFLKEMVLLIRFNIGMSPVSETILLYFMVSTAAFLLYVLLIRTKRPGLVLTAMLTAGILFFAVYWYLYVDGAYWGLVLFTASWLWCWSWLRQHRFIRHWVKQGVRVPGRFAKLWQRSAVVYIMAVLIVSLALPKPAALIKVQQLEQKLLLVFPFLSHWRTPPAPDSELFSIKVTGFQNDSQLGGPVIFNDTPLFKFVNYGLSGSIYLKGSVRDTYQNNSWVKRNTASSAIQDDLSQPVVASIRHLDLSTRTLFVPAGKPVTLSYKGTVYRYPDGDFAAAKAVDSGQSYLIRLASTNADIDELQYYLQLPEDLPKRVRHRAERLTRDYQDPFLKIKALEYYLRANYEYSLRPPVTPRGRDFVDYFLFDLKEGYCTYFATALAIMGRAAGIPTRYVEGLRVGEMEGHEAIVTASQGHAWVEAYVPGKGWILLEPTPIYEYEQIELIPTSGPTAPWERPDDYGYLDPNELAPPRSGGELPDNAPIPETPNTDTQPAEQGAYRSHLLNLLLLTMVLVISVLTGRYLRVRNYLNTLKSLPPSRRVAELYKIVLRQLELLSLGRQPQETPLEYSQRILSNVYYEETNFAAISAAYTRVFYGGEEATTAEANELERLVELLDNRLRNRLGRLRFVRYRYLDFYGLLKG